MKEPIPFKAMNPKNQALLNAVDDKYQWALKVRAESPFGALQTRNLIKKLEYLKELIIKTPALITKVK